MSTPISRTDFVMTHAMPITPLQFCKAVHAGAQTTLQVQPPTSRIVEMDVQVIPLTTVGAFRKTSLRTLK